MNGHIIEGTPIAVDFWKVRECPQVKLFFLSHMHDDHTQGLTPSWQLPLYTSPISAKLLAHFVKVPAHLVKVLEVGTSHLIPLGETGEESMTVTLIDARHCPGAVMFLFEGYFGTILYTGDFRYDSTMAEDPVFTTFPAVDRLYLDNTYCSQSCTHPTRELVTTKILKTIKARPLNTRVYLGLTRVGKEDLLVAIAQALKEWIKVDPDTYAKMKLLEMPDVFTVDDSSRIHVQPFHVLSRKSFQWQNLGDEPYIIILPSCILGGDFRPPYGPKQNIYDMPYSNHSSFTELTAFVSKIRPRQIIPVVTGAKAYDDMSVFDDLLDPTPCKTFETPKCVENWHVTGGGRRPLVTVKRKRAGVPNLTKGVSFIDEDSRESKSDEKNVGKPQSDKQEVSGDSKSEQAEPLLQASGDSACISDSECDSDSGIFAVLKKLKTPKTVGDSAASNKGKKGPLPLVKGMAVEGITPKTENPSEGECGQDVPASDEVGATASPSEKLMDPQALLDSSLESVPKSLELQIITDDEASSVIEEVDLTLTEDEPSITSHNVELELCVMSEISSVEASNQKELGCSQTSADIEINTTRSGECSQKSEDQIIEVVETDSELDNRKIQSVVNIASEPTSSSVEISEPATETDDDIELLLPFGSGNDIPIVVSSWKHDACLCRAKWRLEEALQEALAYAKGEPFHPFIYSQQHNCQL